MFPAPPPPIKDPEVKYTQVSVRLFVCLCVSLCDCVCVPLCLSVNFSLCLSLSLSLSLSVAGNVAIVHRSCLSMKITTAYSVCSFVCLQITGESATGRANENC